MMRHALSVPGTLDSCHARFPRVSKLPNYLHVTYTGKVGKPPSGGGLKQLADEHPDYLFTRVALSTKAQDKDQLEKTAAQLGPTLDIRNLYPQRSLSHVSELRN